MEYIKKLILEYGASFPVILRQPLPPRTPEQRKEFDIYRQQMQILLDAVTI
jgi:hypothetical protein